LLLALARPATADSWHEGERGRERKIHLLATLGGAAFYVATETVLKATINSDECRWCAVPGFDAEIRDALLWDDRARAERLGDRTGYLAAPLFAFGVSVLPLLGNDAGWAELIDTTLPILESVIVSQTINQILKPLVGRERPSRHYDTEPDLGASSDNKSFISGHTSLAFSLAASAGMVAHWQHTRSEPAVWAIGMTIAAATGYFRIAGDTHYASDVVAGALVGTAAGLLIPRLTKHDIAVVPISTGAAVVGSF